MEHQKSHGSAATTASRAQAPRPTRQPSSAAASEMGTVSVRAPVRPMDSAVV